jgi:hypothetical protein
MARSVPGEFAADALIRMASLESLEKPRRIELLNLAFQRASEAQEPVKRQPAIVKVPGAAGFLTRAFAQDLDAMSLRLRSVESMEKLDKARASALFRQIPPLALPKLKCSDFMVYSVAPYYQALERLGSSSQVLAQLEGMSSPAEIGPASKLVAAASSDSDFQARLAAFVRGLGKIAGDDRSFTFAGDLGPQILPLVDAAKVHKVSPLPMLEAYRLYLVRNEQTARCVDDDLMGPVDQQTFVLSTGAPPVGGEGVNFFNEKLKTPPLQAIQEQEVTPTRLQGVAEGLRGCDNRDCQTAALQYNLLIFDPESRTPYPPAHKNSPEWQAQVKKLLEELAKMKPDTTVTPAQFYRQKTASYIDLLSLVPAGPLQEEVVKALVDFAQNNDFQRESRMEWFLPLNILLGKMALDPMGTGKSAPYLRQSKDPVVVMYAALEAVAPRTPDKLMSLM